MRYRARLALPLIPLLAGGRAQAREGWPAKPVKLIVPFPPGGSTDAQARVLAQRLSEVWGQPVVPENKPGAGTVLATQTVAKSPPDGYTLGVSVSSLAINPTLRPNLPYDTLKDLQPVSELGIQHIVLAAGPGLPVASLAELLELAKRQPGRLSYATPGSGTAHHLVMELLKSKAGVDITHVPYKGGAPAQQDVVGGRVPLLMDIHFASLALIRAGRLRPLALFSATRPASIPDIPLVAETVPGVVAMSTVGIIAPAGTPADIVQKISADIGRLVRTPDFSAKLLEMGLDPIGSTPQEYEQRLRADIAKWAPIIRATGATAD